MKVLITGATGFIGSCLAQRLAEKGDTVRALVRRTSNLSFLKTLPVQLCYGDLDDRESLITAVKGTEVVYHSGAKLPQRGSWKGFYRANVEGTQRILDVCLNERVGRLVYLSTVGVFGIKDLDNINESYPLSKSGEFYTDTKMEAEILVKRWMEEKRLPISVIYPTITYGPRDGNLVLRAVKLLRMGIIPAVGGRRSRAPFTYVENLVDGIISAGTQERAIGRSYIISDEELIPWADFLSRMAQEMGIKARVMYVPYYPLYALLLGIDLMGKILLPWMTLRSVRTGLRYFAARRSFDTTLARKELGWTQRISLQEGIGLTVRWLKEGRYI